ncbi:MAG TPA: endonuclease V, partial [Polyangiaceae bacterium]|nr:endonuclease V [Polyangiaceae bacterium]
MSSTPAKRQPFLAILDVHYFVGQAQAACVVSSRWSDADPLAEYTAIHPSPADYEPGAFCKRELPPLLSVLAELPVLPPLLVVDGYVWLDRGRPGLGYRLQQALPERPIVVGVAKTSFAGNRAAIPVMRRSSRPLFVTAIGMPVEEAAEHVRAMAG